MSHQPPDRKPTWLKYGGVGFEFAAAVACFALLGYWIDRHYATEPWGLVVGAFLGLVGGTYNLIRSSMAAFKELEPRSRDADDKNADQERSEGP